MKYLLIALGIFIFHNAQADFKLTHGGNYKIDLPSEVSKDIPYYKYNRETNEITLEMEKKTWDVSKFYKPENSQYYIGGRYIKDNHIISFTYDNGLDTSKLDINQSIKLGYTNVQQLKDNVYLSMGVSHRFGGEVRHTSCKDDLNREYYCGSLTSWKDFDKPENKDDYSGNIKLTIRF